MATLTTKDITLADPDPALAAAGVAGDQFTAENGVLFVVKNDDAASKTVTFASQVDDAPGVTGTDLAVTVPANAIRVVPFGDHPSFKDADGFINVTYSDVTSLSVAAVK